MPQPKAAKKSAPAKVKIKVHTATRQSKKASTAQRATAVAENLGTTQSLRDFLSEVGWR